MYPSNIIGFVTNTNAIDGLKKKFLHLKTLLMLYKELFGDDFDKAQRRFIESLAGYSIICYLLQIKDRCVSYAISI